LVEAVTNGKIEARRVTTQGHVTFDLNTGQTLANNPELRCTIDSITPLPAEIHDVMLGLDRKMRLRFDKLSRDEKDALLFIADFYPANPLR
jgi:hypothetical protein